MVPACRRPPNTPAQRGEGELGAVNRALPTAAPPALLTWHVWGLLQAAVRAAILGALHKVGWLVHVLGKARRSPHCWGSRERGRWGRSWELHWPLTIHMPSNGTCWWKSFTMSCHHSCVSGLVKSGKAVGPGHTCRRVSDGQNPRTPEPWHPLVPPGCSPPSRHSPQPPHGPHAPGRSCAPHTFPISGCPVALRMNTPLFSPSS